jgi:hypothetical protein
MTLALFLQKIKGLETHMTYKKNLMFTNKVNYSITWGGKKGTVLC